MKTVPGSDSMSSLWRRAKRRRPAYNHSTMRLTGLRSIGRIVSRDIHKPVASTIPAMAAVAQPACSPVHVPSCSRQTKWHRAAAARAIPMAVNHPSHRGERELFKRTRHSIGTTVNATIRLAANAAVLVQANGANSL